MRNDDHADQKVKQALRNEASFLVTMGKPDDAKKLLDAVGVLGLASSQRILAEIEGY